MTFGEWLLSVKYKLSLWLAMNRWVNRGLRENFHNSRNVCLKFEILCDVFRRLENINAKTIGMKMRMMRNNLENSL